MKVLVNMLLAFFLVGGVTVSLQAQCETWNNSPKKDEAENAHVLYRQFAKGKSPAEMTKLSEENFKILFDNWKKAYKLAPAADGQRSTHYADGRDIYKALMTKTTDEAKKKEYSEMIMKLYDQQIECYKNEAYLLGRKAFDMFYDPHHGYRESTLNTFKEALEKGGNDTEYIVFEPLAQLMVYMFQNDKLSQQETQGLYTKMEEIIDYNVENNERYNEYYESTRARMSSHFTAIENDVFDCEYFKEKMMPKYQDNKDSLDVVKYVYNKLKTQGCDSTAAYMVEIRSHYEKLATEINKGLEADRRLNNPCYDAIQLQKEGDYTKALARYQECLNSDPDDETKAQVYYSMAFIKTWQTGDLGTARSYANKAASMKSGWGKPYILIGDIYVKLSRNCGDAWNSGLAVLAAIEKYAYAKSVDSNVADDANKRIGNISGSRPEKQEGFMRGVTEGASAKVGCGIGETVTVRFK